MRHSCPIHGTDYRTGCDSCFGARAAAATEGNQHARAIAVLLSLILALLLLIAYLGGYLQ